MHMDILHLLKEELESTLIRHKLKGIKELQSLHDLEPAARTDEK
jgi:predicted nuclease with TOPRIM domain